MTQASSGHTVWSWHETMWHTTGHGQTTDDSYYMAPRQTGGNKCQEKLEKSSHPTKWSGCWWRTVMGVSPSGEGCSWELGCLCACVSVPYPLGLLVTCSKTLASESFLCALSSKAKMPGAVCLLGPYPNFCSHPHTALTKLVRISQPSRRLLGFLPNTLKRSLPCATVWGMV